MNTSSHQEVSAQFHETDFGGPPLQKQKRIIYFSSGETLELEDPEEEEAEEQPSNRTPFEQPGRRTRISFKNVAILVGRMSLLACDFLGERLAGALGLNAAKYQYAIDQYHREHKGPIKSSLLRAKGMGGSTELWQQEFPRRTRQRTSTFLLGCMGVIMELRVT
ncbi:protein FAM177A1 isoform X2 [Fundulus heteroclitus]|uniref:protein FAM177A1 isoform X2 n=1 Tax=Fundulus heteroclitus TaxID=8078 RepID=UPI00165B9923|nr:protein FAM177A1 isoform X2 [Fundulus heteroclitus]